MYVDSVAEDPQLLLPKACFIKEKFSWFCLNREKSITKLRKLCLKKENEIKNRKEERLLLLGSLFPLPQVIRRESRQSILG